MSLDDIVTTRLAILLDVNEEGLPEILIDKPEISVDITDIIILKPNSLSMTRKYDGMTVNERLFVAKKIDEFYKAVNEKDRIKVISILQSVELTESSIYPILVSLGL